MKKITASRWSDIVQIANDYPMHFFRGQASADWVLESSLHRAIRAHGIIDDCDIIEYFLLRAFRRGARRYIDNVPPDDDYIGWLSLMQHHGTPSRLLDVTHSCYVATYFALIDAQQDSAVWIVDPEFLFRTAGIDRTEGRHGIKREWQPSANEIANQFLRKRLGTTLAAAEENAALGVVPIEPEQQHDRLATQQGLFLMPFDALGTIESNLSPHIRGGKTPLRKVVLKAGVREEGLRQLMSMNITAETLFPGLDGFARSLLHTQIV